MFSVGEGKCEWFMLVVVFRKVILLAAMVTLERVDGFNPAVVVEERQ